MEPINVHDYERLARERLSPDAWAYYLSGAADEVTLREERAAFERLRILPRVLRSVSHADPDTTVLGAPVSMPILIAPPPCTGSLTPRASAQPPARPGRRARSWP